MHLSDEKPTLGGVSKDGLYARPHHCFIQFVALGLLRVAPVTVFVPDDFRIAADTYYPILCELSEYLVMS